MVSWPLSAAKSALNQRHDQSTGVMSNEEVLAKLQQIFRKVLSDNSIVLTESTTAKDVAGWDSLSHVMLVVEIEDSFKKRFKSREIQNWQCVGDMVTSLQNS